MIITKQLKQNLFHLNQKIRQGKKRRGSKWILFILMMTLFIFFLIESADPLMASANIPLHLITYNKADSGSIWSVAILLLLSSFMVAVYPFDHK